MKNVRVCVSLWGWGVGGADMTLLPSAPILINATKSITRKSDDIITPLFGCVGPVYYTLNVTRGLKDVKPF